MRQSLATTLFCCAVLVAGPCAAATSPLKLLYKVDSCAATLHGDRMTIIASGAASTGGWTKARLRPVPQRNAPDSNTITFDFVAMPPSPDQAVIQALVPQTVSITVRAPRHGETQIRVNAQTNSTTAQIAPGTP